MRPLRIRSVTRRRSQAGVTLVEVLVMIGVVVPVVIGATYGMFTAVETSRRAELQARLEAVMSARTEELKSGNYIECATPDQYTQSLSTSDTSSSTEVIRVRYWSQETAAFRDLETCERSDGTDNGGSDDGTGQNGGGQNGDNNGRNNGGDFEPGHGNDNSPHTDPDHDPDHDNSRLDDDEGNGDESSSQNRGVDGGAQQLRVKVTIDGESLIGVVVSRDANSLPVSPTGANP